MLNLQKSAAGLITGVGGGSMRSAAQEVRARALDLDGWGDELLREECRRLLSGGGDISPRGWRRPWLRRLADSLLGRRFEPLQLETVALGVAAFRRAPADLKPGSYLYYPQIEAAVALTQRCVIQMDTGEGKTYALLPAGFALACRYGRVFVLCANEYLAHRDAGRTLSFWRFVGLSVGLAIEGTPESAWRAQIVYTTLRKFMFKRMQDQIAYDHPAVPLSSGGAVLVDEADAVLIDGSFEAYSLVDHVQSSSFNWANALQIATELRHQEHVTMDVNPLRANLTVAGEALLRDRLGGSNVDDTQYLLMRHAVELAYVASRVAEEDVHYIREDDRLFIIDPITGQVNRHFFPSWLTPLAFIKGMAQRPPALTQDKLWPTNLLSEFPHLSGMSGAVAEDAVEYLLSYMLWTHVVPPRFPRAGELKSDRIFRTLEGAYHDLAEHIEAAVAAGRPVLIGAQTISEADEFTEYFRRHFGHVALPNLLTAKNDYEAAEFFTRAGRAGTVTVATQLAGRGVDIRLTEEVKAARGLALFGLGHSLTARHDRQLIGRAGRQGDPFTVRFFNSLQDSFFTRFSGFLERWVSKLGVKESEVIESPIIDRAIGYAQTSFAQSEFVRRRHAGEMSMATRESRARFFGWFDACRVHDGDRYECSDYFVDLVLNHFGEFVVAPMLRREHGLSFEAAHAVIAHLAEALAVDSKQLHWLLADDLVGADATAAADTIRKRASAELRRVFGDAKDRRHEARQEVDASVAATRLAAPALQEEARGFFPAPTTVGGGDAAEEAGAVTATPDAPMPDVSDAWARIYKARARQNALEARCPRRIAYAVLRQMWAAHLEELDRLDFQVAQGGHAPINRYRLLRERIFRAQRQLDAQISRRLMASLLRADAPESLDHLFLLLEHRVVVEQPSRALPLVTWQAEDSDAEWERFEGSAKREDVISHFVRFHGDGLLSSSFSEVRLRRLLLDFTQRNPFSNLSRPDLILDALHDWGSLVTDRGVGRAERQQQRRALGEFLVYLRQRNLIGPLPRLQDRMVATSYRLAANLSGLRVMLPLLGLAAFVMIFIGLGYVSVGATYERLTGIGAVADSLLFGGMLATGGMSGLILGALASACILANLMQPYLGLAEQLTKLGKVIFWLFIPLLIVGAYWSEADRRGLLSLLVGGSVAIFLALALGEFVRKALAAIYTDTGLSIISLWLAYTSFAVLIVGLAALTPTIYPFLGVFGSAVALLYVWRWFNRCEIALLSRRPTGATATAGEDTQVSAEVRGDVGVGPHAIGVLVAWSVVDATSSALTWSGYGPSLGVALAVYFITSAILIRHQLSLRLALPRWQARLTEMRQVPVRQQWGDRLEEMLPRVRHYLYRRELLLLVALSIGFGGAGAISGSSDDIAVGVTLFGLLAAVVFATHSASFAAQLYRFVFNQGAVMPITFEASKLVD